MDLFTRVDLEQLLAERDGPCVSLFMPTSRGGSEADPIDFRKLLAQAEERLVGRGVRSSEAREMLAPLHALEADALFWRNQCDGLAIFLARGFVRTYRLPVSFPEDVTVGGLFHVSPLLPLLAGDGRFFVLALSQNGVRLYQGTRFAISAIDLKGLPRNLAEALRTHDTDEPLTFHTRPTSGGSWGAIFEGHGVGIDDHKNDLLRYFQQIDHAVHEVLREERAPLIVAAVEYLLPIYRQANSYPHLLAHGIAGNPDRLGEKELHDRAWAIVGPHFQEELRVARARYDQAARAGKATSDLKALVLAAFRGELATLFVARDRHLWGILDLAANRVELHETQEVGDEDLLNLAATHVWRHGHVVYVLPQAEVPGGGLLAGMQHLPLPKHGKRP